MNPIIFKAAGRQVELASRKMTDLETVHKCNMARRVALPDGFYNKVFLSRNEDGRFKPVPKEIIRARPLWSGTFAVVGSRGRRLGNRLERQAYYEGREKTLIMETGGAPAEVMVCCNQGFGRGGLPHLQFFNARTEKPIDTHEGMLEPPEVIMRFNGQKYAFLIWDRDGGILETVDDLDVLNRVADSATGGLLWRGGDFGGFDGFYGGQEVGLGGRPSYRFWVVMEAGKAGALPETKNSNVGLFAVS